MMAKITGLGGVFYVVEDPEATREWYRDKLDIDGEYGPQLAWSEESKPNPYSLISHFKDDTYVKPGKGTFMINLRVDDLGAFVKQIKKKGVKILDSVDEGYGKFAWILDPNGVKIELWEQVDEALPD
ncbi:VOC family protein [Altererythrobacter sp.]|uniref:VOC family protein n=1 Tax=Altererythrobacter sp. TaxID=1872480 RepID=UPI00341CB6D2